MGRVFATLMKAGACLVPASEERRLAEASAQAGACAAQAPAKARREAEHHPPPRQALDSQARPQEWQRPPQARAPWPIHHSSRYRTVAAPAGSGMAGAEARRAWGNSVWPQGRGRAWPRAPDRACRHEYGFLAGRVAIAQGAATQPTGYCMCCIRSPAPTRLPTRLPTAAASAARTIEGNTTKPSRPWAHSIPGPIATLRRAHEIEGLLC
jgi:hypothetical protein